MQLLILISLLTFSISTIYAAVITKDDMVDLCQATGKIMLAGLTTKTLDQASKQQRDFLININGENTSLTDFGESTIEAIVSLFTDGLIRMYLGALSISSAAIRDLQSLQANTISSFCTKLPLPESIDTENPVKTLTTLINYVNSLTPASSSVVNSTIKSN